MIILIDDDTLDTVLECDICNHQARYLNDSEMSMQAFVAWAIADANDIHVCEPSEEGK